MWWYHIAVLSQFCRRDVHIFSANFFELKSRLCQLFHFSERTNVLRCDNLMFHILINIFLSWAPVRCPPPFVWTWKSFWPSITACPSLSGRWWLRCKHERGNISWYSIYVFEEDKGAGYSILMAKHQTSLDTWNAFEEDKGFYLVLLTVLRNFPV